MADQVDPIDISDLVPCHACRALLPAGADTCAACGTAVGDDVPAASTTEVTEPPPPRRLVWVGVPAAVLAVASFVLAVIGGVGFLIIGGAVLTLAIVVVRPPGEA